MFKNYLTVTVRSLLKNKVFTSINILGLALGITSSFLVFIYINYHNSFDEKYKNSNMYRVLTDTYTTDNQFVRQFAFSLHFLAPEVQKNFSSVEESVRMFEFETLLVYYNNDIFFNKTVPNAYFLRPQNIAVNVGGKWKFYNPGYNYIQLGMLRWQEEGQESLITDPKNPIWVNTPMSSHEKSLVKRTAKLKLADDGTLEGDVRVEYTGHFAVERKQELDEQSETAREETLKEEMKSQMSAAEISNIVIENVTDHVKPLVLSYRVRFPGYATRTGKRLFLQPAFFQNGLKPLFATSTRKYPIYFHYPWSENDEVEFTLPKGYALDNADAPAPFGSGEISAYKPSLLTRGDDDSVLIYKRSFFFGGGESLHYPVAAYPNVKNYFDAVHKQDSHSIALKQTATN